MAQVYIRDGVAFAYNPNIVRVSGATPATGRVETIISMGNEVYTDKRHCDKSGNCEYNISAYLQAFFKGVNSMTTFDTSCKVQIQIYVDDIKEYDSTIEVVYGSMFVGDIFNLSPSTHIWFVNYPQTFSWHRVADGEVSTQVNNLPYSMDSFGMTKTGIVTMPLADIFRDFESIAPEDIDSAEFQDVIEGGALSTFTVEFDGTFVDLTSNTQLHRFIACHRNCGKFLRWVDQQGMWQYWLFHEGTDATSIGAYGENIPTSLSLDTFDIMAERVQGKVAKKTINIAEPLCNKDRFEFLRGMLLSPCVSVYEGGAWIPANVGGNATWNVDTKHLILQDFDAVIEYPTIPTQRL